MANNSISWARKAALRWALKGKLPGPRAEAVAKALSDADFERLFRGAADPGALFQPKTVAETENMYRFRDLVFTCIRRIVTAHSEAKPEVGLSGGSGGWTKSPSHWAAKLLKRPNPAMSWGQFAAYHLTHKLTTGRSFLWKWRNGAGEVAELWPAPTNWVSVVPLREMSDDPADARRVVDFFKVQTPGCKAEAVPVGDIIDVKFIDPLNFTGASGPLQAALRSLDLDEKRENYMMELLTNIQVPGLVVRQREDWTPEQKEDVRAALADAAGTGKRGGTVFVSGDDLSGISAIAPLSDLDWPGLTSLSETRVCAAFGVPPALAGLRAGLESTGLSGQDVDNIKRMFYETTVSELWASDSDALTHGLLAMEGEPDDVEIRFEVSGVRALRDSSQAASESAARLVVSGVAQVNEARELAGLPKDPNREGVYLVPIGVVEVDASPAGRRAAAEAEAAEEARHLNGMEAAGQDDPPAGTLVEDDGSGEENETP